MMGEFWEHWQNWLVDTMSTNQWKTLMERVEQEYAQPFCFPPKEMIFNAFDHCLPHEVKCVIVGQDPYHGMGEAHGLSFSVPMGVKLPPSLRNIFKELASDLGETRILSDLTDWAEQGVLLLNAHLTVRKDQPFSHRHLGWEWFTDGVLRKLVVENPGIIVVLWGNEARKKKSLLLGLANPIIESAHPSPLGAYRGFMGSKPFSRINQILKDQGKPPVRWA
jgi:uracil-DNA glycosylase